MYLYMYDYNKYMYLYMYDYNKYMYLYMYDYNKYMYLYMYDYKKCKCIVYVQCMIILTGSIICQPNEDFFGRGHGPANAGSPFHHPSSMYSCTHVYMYLANHSSKEPWRFRDREYKL